MTTSLDQMLTKLKIKGKLLTHQEPDPDIGVGKNYCSYFLKSKGVLIKGEEDNQKKNERKSLITLMNPETGEILGGNAKIGDDPKLVYMKIYTNPFQIGPFKLTFR